MADIIRRHKNLHHAFIPPSLMRAFAIKRMASLDMSFPDFHFKIAACEAEMVGAFELLEESYVRRGIANEGKMRLKLTSLLPTTTTFVAKKGDEVIGTMSLIEDSELGLPVEKVHGPDVRRVRGLHRRVAEVGALAVRPAYRGQGVNIMLYNMMFRWARFWRGVDDLVIAVHPAAGYFYRNILLFRRLGPVRPYPDYNDTSSVTMGLDLPGAQSRFLRAYRGRVVDRKTGHDFYDFFAAPSDRFDFSAHPEGRRRPGELGALDAQDVERLMDRFALGQSSLDHPEERALRRHFPSLRQAGLAQG